MEKLDIYIHRLLNDQECAVIPGFGGFLLRDVTSAILNQGQEIYPPARTVSFNKNLNLNDGLLAQFISVTENISYTEALLYISKETELLHKALASGSPVHFHKTGTLVLNEDKKYIFSPDKSYNYLKSSYGLSAIMLSVVDKPAQGRVVKMDKPAFVIPSFIRPAAAVAAVAASLIIAFLVFFQYNKVNPGQVAEAAYQSGSIKPIADSINKIISDAAYPAKPATDSAVAGTGFYVVGGSFKNENNARTFADILSRKGFKSKILNTDNGFFRVTYMQDNDSLSADKALHKIKITENQSAWLLKW